MLHSAKLIILETILQQLEHQLPTNTKSRDFNYMGNL